jgi:hypothetical protein
MYPEIKAGRFDFLINNVPKLFALIISSDRQKSGIKKIAFTGRLFFMGTISENNM